MIWFNGQALRIEYPAAIYHVFNRGDRREAIFGLTLIEMLFLIY